MNYIYLDYDCPDVYVYFTIKSYVKGKQGNKFYILDVDGLDIETPDYFKRQKRFSTEEELDAFLAGAGIKIVSKTDLRILDNLTYEDKEDRRYHLLMELTRGVTKGLSAKEEKSGP